MRKTFSQNLKAIAGRGSPKNKAIFKLLVNKMPVRRISKSRTSIPHFYNRLDFLHRQCQLFAAHRERGLSIFPFAGCTLASTGKITW